MQHGYRIPEEEGSYYMVRFWRGEPFTYPKLCLTQNFPIITPLPKSAEEPVLSRFLTSLKTKMPYFLGKPLVVKFDSENRNISASDLKLDIQDPQEILTPEEYKCWLENQEAMYILEIERIEISNKEENDKWEKAEKVAIENWRKLQEKNEQLRLKHLQEIAKRKLEWEMEKKRREEEAERLKEIEEENKRKQKIFMEKLEQFLKGDSEDPPEELLVSRESRPNTNLCPFFLKTACCRFGDECSRNHQYPGISKVLLATNFYSHFGLENSNFNEYDTDLMLEYDDKDTYKHFEEFFNDVLPEFEKYGKVVQLKVCNNYEKHLRGNTYVEFRDLRSAVAAYQGLHSRWYGGRQLSLQFCKIKSWENAICGLHPQRRCPKGRGCNYLHVFRNPKDLFSGYNSHRNRQRRTPPRSWRWSESPERDPSPKRRRSRSRNSRQDDEGRSSRHHNEKDRDIPRKRKSRRDSVDR
ncbi:U2 small nuclear ribonucleoprotein auxiliary factor 35 kDa subunit-related protein 1 [Papilio machaon]|uniref:U2 small nuclear ribonucleoprotein auxiliary factor 35 kDa subunit-related protein 1 n=1 Tax=Papilio machaon TaxID=76193 RepID=A0A194R1V1_PAPMA|nr:U2 small nuclear ribonucleoprotein auxiliary factor 35 kDa subunit-related protein 1 [Papilio machaon]